MHQGVRDSLKSPTIGAAMVAIAAVAAALSFVADEGWRWGYPRRLPIERRTALGWLGTVSRSDYRKYDRLDVASLLKYIAREGLLVGESRERVEGLLGTPFGWKTPARADFDPTDFYFAVGIGPLWNGPGPPELCCRFDVDGKCIEVIPPGSE
jgi:hypothetical protein